MKTLLTNWRSYLIAFFISLGVCFVVFVTGYIKGNQSGQAKIQAKWDKEKSAQLTANLKASEEARKKEQQYAEKVAKVDKEGLDKIKELEREKNSIIDSLKRDNIRLSIAIKTSSSGGTAQKDTNTSVDTGTTQAELSDEAFRFLAGEASRADRITVQLGACQKVIEADQVLNVREELF